MLNAIARLALLLSSLVVTGVAHAVALPPGSVADPVASDIAINGKSGSIQRFVVKARSDEVAAHFRRSFKGKFVEPAFPGYKVMAAQEGAEFRTVRFREVAPGVVEGFVMSTPMEDLRQGVKAIAPPVWLPPQSVVVSEVRSRDAGQRGTTIVALSHSSMEGSREHLRRTLTGQGYVIDREANDAATGASTYWFVKPDGEMSVTVSRQRAHTTLVAHLISNQSPVRELPQ